MVRTHGLTHISLKVRDLEAAAAFYAHVFGAIEIAREADNVQLQTPGARDVIVLTRAPERAGFEGGVSHFGFQLSDPSDIEEAVRVVRAAGGTLVRRGESSPGIPFAFVRDPDGYEIEIFSE